MPCLLDVLATGMRVARTFGRWFLSLLRFNICAFSFLIVAKFRASELGKEKTDIHDGEQVELQACPDCPLTAQFIIP